MASSKKSTASRRSRTHGLRTQGRPRIDAIALLKADHRQVEEWFSQFQSASKARKQQLADRICEALTVHTAIEEEIFYPSTPPKTRPCITRPWWSMRVPRNSSRRFAACRPPTIIFRRR